MIMSWYKFSQLSFKVGDIIKYKMGSGPYFPVQEAKIISIGDGWYEVIDNSMRKLKIYPKKFVQ